MRPNWVFETCSLCTREQRLAWFIPNELWNKVVINNYKNQVLCMECFLRMADDREVNIKLEDIEISGIVFRGD